ncbi:hypothetical protein [Cellulosimicrobium protaetiae]|uniref:Uncharacterized protein n=1 Tax=Cellulosimicrobium protaetiae TaxID=2587808 RepID=A0A6M5UE80_9MICO|nr:hypothetical protein [Cellulosimicrobium protaetiae]QJW35962.1 hypothetical protein FIC82_006900 [Cellulosimicrobium protaetiae]
MRARTLREGHRPGLSRPGPSAPHLLAAAALALASLAVAAPALGTPAGVSDVCDGVRTLVDAAQPEAALAQVTALRAEDVGTPTTSSGTTTTFDDEGASTAVEESQSPALPCADEEALALDAIERAQALADEAAALVPTDARGAQEKAQEALAVDAENETAAEAKSAADAALAQPVGTFSAAWTRFVDRYVEPLTQPAVVLVVVLAGLFVVARALTPTTLSWPRLGPRTARTVGVTGAVSIVTAALTLTWATALDLMGTRARVGDGWWRGASVVWVVVGLGAVVVAVMTVVLFARLPKATPGSGAQGFGGWPVVLSIGAGATLVFVFLVGRDGAVPPDPSRAGDVPVAAAGLSLAVLGVGLTTVFLATRLRVRVDVRGEEAKDPALESGHLVALLRELGGTSARGLEMPRGTDVETLRGGVLSELPQNAVLKVLTSLVTGLAGSLPWRVVVEERGTSLAVVITRNGRLAGSAVVSHDRLVGRVAPVRDGAQEPEPEDDAAATPADSWSDLQRAAAAVVLTTLARHHTGFEGLCGTTSWRSLALFDLATSVYDHDEETQKGLLAAACSDDPGNLPAQVALARVTMRRSDTFEKADRYVRWLTELVGRARVDGSPRPGHEVLVLRALYTRAAVAINASFAANDGRRSRPDGRARSAVEELEAELHSRPAGREGEQVVERVRAAATAMSYRLWTTVETITIPPAPGPVVRTAEGAPPCDHAAHRGCAHVVPVKVIATLALPAGPLALCVADDRSVRVIAEDAAFPGGTLIIEGSENSRHRTIRVRAESALFLGPITVDTTCVVRFSTGPTSGEPGKEPRSRVEPLDPDDATTPASWYNLGCYYASRPATSEAARIDDALATEQFLRARVHPSARTWIKTDPVLTTYRTSESYRVVFGAEPLGSFLAIGEIARHRDLLEQAGIRREDDVPASPGLLLQSCLALSPRNAADIVQIARLVLAVPHSLATIRYEIAEAAIGTTGRPYDMSLPTLPEAKRLVLHGAVDRRLGVLALSDARTTEARHHLDVWLDLEHT